MSQGGRTHLVLDRKVDEVGVDQNLIRRPQLRIVLEEECRGRLLDVPHFILLLRFRGLFGLLLWRLDVFGVQQPLHLRKLPRLLGLAHPEAGRAGPGALAGLGLLLGGGVYGRGRNSMYKANGGAK